MRKLTLLIMGLLLSSSLFAEMKVFYVSGAVSVANESGQTQNAQPGMLLNVGDKVITGADGKSVLVVDEKTRIWVKRDTSMEVKSVGEESYFNLLAGRIRAKVKLLNGRKFKVATPVAVASIRGTDFDFTVSGVLAVFEGKIELTDSDMANLIEVAQGQIGQIGTQTRDMTPEEIAQFNEDWGDFSDDEGANGEKNKDGEQKKASSNEDIKKEMSELRQELRAIVSQIRSEIGQTRERTNEIKESDMSAGRTLKDVHGNLVRVEQHLFRPDNATLQILNLTKRSDYRYGDRNGWGYSGPATSRLDVMEINVKMNMALPEQLTEWPSFISSKGDDMHPQEVTLRFTNQSDEIKNVGVWTLKGQPAEKTGEFTSEDRLVFSGTINGWTVDPNYDAKDDPNAYHSDALDASGSDDGELWAWGISPQIKIDNGSQTKYVRIGTEGYGINNGGKILNIKDFTSSAENPFTLLKKVAAEEIIFCRESSSSDFANSTEFFTKGNIDLITTPDLILAIAQKLASQVGEMSKSSSNE